MVGVTIRFYGMLLIAFIVVLSFLIFIIYYRKYYKYMKIAHKNEWWALMKRDPAIETAGEWIRWPIGSIYLFVSIFNQRQTYNDNKVIAYKKNLIYSIVTFIVSFTLFLLITIIYPKC